MTGMVRGFAAVAILVLCAVSAFAVGTGKAKYMGGTLASMPDRTEGPIDLKGEDKLVFKPAKVRRLEIPWSSIEELEYGQKVARRWRTAILISPVALLARARKHFVTVTYKDSEGKDQAVVFEFPKGDIRQNLTILKTRSGKEITFQDEEAKKQMGGGVADSK